MALADVFGDRANAVVAEIGADGQIAFPEDIAAAVVFLAQRESGYITGQVTHVNGGSLMP